MELTVENYLRRPRRKIYRSEVKRYPKVSARALGLVLTAWLALTQQSDIRQPIEPVVLPTTSPATLQLEDKALTSVAETPALSEAQYAVKPQDTLIDIATNFGTTVERIIKDNKIQNSDLVFAGQKLRVTYSQEALELIQTSGVRNIKQLIQQ